MRHHYRRHCHHRHHHHGSRWFNPLYWITGLAIIEAALWALALEIIALWWLLWAAAYGATRAIEAMWGVTQPAGTAPDWQRALNNARPPLPRHRPSRPAAVTRRYATHP